MVGKNKKSRVQKKGVKSSAKKAVGATNTKNKHQVVSGKPVLSQQKKSYQQKKHNFAKKMPKKIDDNQIINEAMADAQGGEFVDSQMSSLAAEQ